MVVSVYSIYDVKSCLYGQPFYSHNDNVAVRSFQDLQADSSSMVHRHPDDFRLYKLGNFNDITGMMSCISVPFLVLDLNLLKDGE